MTSSHSTPQAAEETLDDFNPAADAPDAEAPTTTDSATDALTRERDDWRDKAYRAAAEAENVRRRTGQELADARQYAVSKFAADMLGVADNLARALTAPEGNEKALRDGVAMTAAQLQTTLSRHGIALINVKPGDALNADLHQAMSEAPTSQVPAGHIMQELQPGFTLNGRLLRPALVIVAKPEETGEELPNA